MFHQPRRQDNTDMKKSTKERIIEKAVELFNKRGYANVSLQDLANEMGMSRGNLAYHFAEKDLLLKSIVDQVWGRMAEESQKRRNFPSFQNVHNEVKLYHALHLAYSFIFGDLRVLKHPVLRQQFKASSLQSIKDNEEAIAYGIQIGSMKAEPFPGIYYNLALIIWMLSIFWVPQQSIRDQEITQDPTKAVWTLMLPYLTEKGIRSFKKVFGEDYFDSLGAPFRVNLDHLEIF